MRSRGRHQPSVALARSIQARVSKELLSVVVTVVDPQRQYLERCVSTVRAQTHTPIELVLVDNTALQDIRVEPGDAVARVETVLNSTRRSWFCENYNLGIARARGAAVVVLNLDAFLDPGFVSAVWSVLRERSDVGLVSGKVLRMDESARIGERPVIDSAGLVLTLDQRHLDRGAGELDAGQYDRPEYIFGATGAVLTIRRETLNDVVLDGACFDPDYVHGREDGDLCLRAQLFGWKCYYTPTALAYHVRTMRPGARRALPAWINWHQVKNRFLLRSNNLPAAVQLILMPALLFRDLQALVYCLSLERTSLGAFRWLWRERRRLRQKRRLLLNRRRVTSLYLVGLFFGNLRDRIERAARVVGRRLCT